MKILLYVYALLALAVLDSIWLFSTGGLYKKWLAHLFADKFNFTPAVVFYLVYAAGVVFFVVWPSIKAGTSLPMVLLSGAFLGLLAYAAYDLTNQATMRDWPIVVTIVDIAWGAILTGAASVIAVAAHRYFN